MTCRVLERGTHLGLLQLRVAEGRTNITMAEHALDNFDPLALPNKVAPARMPQLVRCVAGSASRRGGRWVSMPSRKSWAGPCPTCWACCRRSGSSAPPPCDPPPTPSPPHAHSPPPPC